MSPDIEHISFPPSCSESNEGDIAGEGLYSALTAFSVLTCERSLFRVKHFAISASAKQELKLSIAGHD